MHTLTFAELTNSRVSQNVIGVDGVGKTALTLRLAYDKFIEEYDPFGALHACFQFELLALTALRADAVSALLITR